MRIAFLTSQFPGIRMGGIGGYTVAMAGALAAGGHEVHVFTGPLPEDVCGTGVVSAGIHVHAVPDLAERIAQGTSSAPLAAVVGAGGDALHRLALGTVFAEAVLRVHRDLPFDVVEGPEYEGLTVPLLWRLCGEALDGRPAVVTQMHSGSAINQCGNGVAASAEDWAVDAIERAGILLADGVCAPTEAVVRASRRLLGFERAVEIIPLAVAAGGAGLDSPFSPPPSTGPILFVGRIERLKGADVLCRAANQFLQACPDARLEVVGPDTPTAPGPGSRGGGGGRSMKEWMEAHLDAGVRERVQFTGEVSPAMALERMRGARFIVAPSVFENFSLVAAQAIALGRPVVCTAETGTVEVVGEGGVTFAGGDAEALAAAVTRLWHSESLVNSLAAAGFARARSCFSAEGVMRRRVSFYQTIAASRGASAAAWSGAEAALLDPLLRITHTLCGVTDGFARSPSPNLMDGSPGHKLLALMNASAPAAGISRARVVLYGAGKFSSRLLAEQHLWTSAGHRVIGFIDDAPRWKSGGTHLGLPVESPASFQARLPLADQPLVVLSTDTFQEQFWEQTASLRERGIRVFTLGDSSE